VSGRGASATFLYCPESVSEILGPNAEAVFEPQHLRMESGEIAGKTAVAICLLPELERNYTGGDLLYPKAQTRDLSPTQVLSDDQKQSFSVSSRPSIRRSPPVRTTPAYWSPRRLSCRNTI
jgi:hypothetical protein